MTVELVFFIEPEQKMLVRLQNIGSVLLYGCENTYMCFSRNVTNIHLLPP